MVDRDGVACPSRKCRSLAIDDVDQLVEGDEDLPDVAQQEEEDDPEEHESDAAIASTSGLLLRVGEDADGRIGLHRAVDQDGAHHHDDHRQQDNQDGGRDEGVVADVLVILQHQDYKTFLAMTTAYLPNAASNDC